MIRTWASVGPGEAFPAPRNPSPSSIGRDDFLQVSVEHGKAVAGARDEIVAVKGAGPGRSGTGTT